MTIEIKTVSGYDELERWVEARNAIDGRGIVFDDVGIFGVSAAPRSPLRTHYELDDDELERRIEAGFDRLPIRAHGKEGVD